MERPVFLREQANKSYRVLPYYVSKTIVEIPILILTPTITLTLIYWGVEFTDNADAYFGTLFALLMLAQCAAALGYFVSAIFERMESAS